MNKETLLLQKNQNWKEELVKHDSYANPGVAFAMARKWLCTGVAETLIAMDQMHLQVWGFPPPCLIEHPLYYGELLVPDLRYGSVVFLPLKSGWPPSVSLCAMCLPSSRWVSEVFLLAQQHLCLQHRWVLLGWGWVLRAVLASVFLVSLFMFACAVCSQTGSA